jgi:hypothetical protein
MFLRSTRNEIRLANRLLSLSLVTVIILGGRSGFPIQDAGVLGLFIQNGQSLAGKFPSRGDALIKAVANSQSAAFNVLCTAFLATRLLSITVDATTRALVAT